jgi:antitoxin VapB
VDSVKEAARSDADTLLARVRAIQEEMARLPVLDERSPDEIIGYNERGHFD